MNIAAALILAAVATTPAADGPKGVDLARSSEISVGNGRGTVLATLGDPSDRQLNGKREVLQYCARDGLAHNKFLIIWLTDGAVDGMSTYTKTYTGKCDKQFKPIKWAQAPGIDSSAKGQ